LAREKPGKLTGDDLRSFICGCSVNKLKAILLIPSGINIFLNISLKSMKNMFLLAFYE
jgi:hypothetical protein